MGMTVDFSDFEQGLKKFIEDAEPRETAKGLFKAGNELLKDAIEEKPYAPFDEGHLRGSARTNKAEVSRDGAEVVCGFNIVYAARWHELTPQQDAKISWTLPGSGRKYLEAKMANTKLLEKYMKIVGLHLKNALARGGK